MNSDSSSSRVSSWRWTAASSLGRMTCRSRSASSAGDDAVVQGAGRVHHRCWRPLGGDGGDQALERIPVRHVARRDLRLAPELAQVGHQLGCARRPMPRRLTSSRCRATLRQSPGEEGAQAACAAGDEDGAVLASRLSYPEHEFPGVAASRRTRKAAGARRTSQVEIGRCSKTPARTTRRPRRASRRSARAACRGGRSPDRRPPDAAPRPSSGRGRPSCPARRSGRRGAAGAGRVDERPGERVEHDVDAAPRGRAQEPASKSAVRDEAMWSLSRPSVASVSHLRGCAWRTPRRPGASAIWTAAMPTPPAAP